MNRTIPHIQEYLDQEWPGVRLEYNEEFGYWIITDYIAAPDGSQATGLHYKTPWNMRGLVDGERTNRKLLFLLSHPDTGAAIEPSYENIIDTLHAAYVGGSTRAWDLHMDRIERGEDKEEQDKEKEMKEGLRQAWKESKGARQNRVYSTVAGITSSEKAQSFIAQQMQQQSAEDAALMTSAQRRLAVKRAVERWKRRANPDN